MDKKQIIAVTDNGSNIVKALRLANIKRLSCMALAHNLHLFISRDIFANPEFSVLNTIVSKLKLIYKALVYKHEELAQYAEINTQIYFIKVVENAIDMDDGNNFDVKYQLSDETDDFTSLKLSNVTRWNSTLKMIRSFVDNSFSINVALGYTGKSDLTLQTEELAILKGVRGFLEIFRPALLHYIISNTGPKYIIF